MTQSNLSRFVQYGILLACVTETSGCTAAQHPARSVPIAKSYLPSDAELQPFRAAAVNEIKRRRHQEEKALAAVVAKIGSESNDRLQLIEDFIIECGQGETDYLKAFVEHSPWGKDIFTAFCSTGMGPLSSAARTGRLDNLMELLRLGANPNYTVSYEFVLQDQVGNTTPYDVMPPLHSAALSGHFLCMQALIDAGAKADTVSYRKVTAMDILKIRGYVGNDFAGTLTEAIKDCLQRRAAARENSSKDYTWEEQYDEVRSALKERKLRDLQYNLWAKSQLQNVSPDLTRVVVVGAVLALQNGSYDEAVEAARRLIQYPDTQCLALILEARAHLERGHKYNHPWKAINLFLAADEIEPLNAANQSRLAYAYALTNRFEESGRVLKKAILDGSRDATVLLNQARCEEVKLAHAAGTEEEDGTLLRQRLLAMYKSAVDADPQFEDALYEYQVKLDAFAEGTSEKLAAELHLEGVLRSNPLFSRGFLLRSEYRKLRDPSYVAALRKIYMGTDGLSEAADLPDIYTATSVASKPADRAHALNSLAVASGRRQYGSKRDHIVKWALQKSLALDSTAGARKVVYLVEMQRYQLWVNGPKRWGPDTLDDKTPSLDAIVSVNRIDENKPGREYTTKAEVAFLGYARRGDVREVLRILRGWDVDVNVRIEGKAAIDCFVDLTNRDPGRIGNFRLGVKTPLLSLDAEYEAFKVLNGIRRLLKEGAHADSLTCKGLANLESCHPEENYHQEYMMGRDVLLDSERNQLLKATDSDSREILMRVLDSAIERRIEYALADLTVQLEESAEIRESNRRMHEMAEGAGAIVAAEVASQNTTRRQIIRADLRRERYDDWTFETPSTSAQNNGNSDLRGGQQVAWDINDSVTKMWAHARYTGDLENLKEIAAREAKIRAEAPK